MTEPVLDTQLNVMKSFVDLMNESNLGLEFELRHVEASDVRVILCDGQVVYAIMIGTDLMDVAAAHQRFANVIIASLKEKSTLLAAEVKDYLVKHIKL